MLESGAQLCALLYKLVVPDVKDKFIALAGFDNVRYRGTVGPTDKIILVGRGTSVTPRGCRCKNWGIVNDKVVFESELLGIPIK